LFLSSQDKYGVAEPVSPDENLDVTTASSVHAGKVSGAAAAGVDVAKTPVAKLDKDKSNTKTPVLTSAQEGLSVAQKLFFVGAIVALCVLFLRAKGGKSNTGGGSFKEKSMA